MTGGSARREENRGQTTPDFVVGISVFLLTVAFVVAFVPQLLVPAQAQDEAAVSDRIAATLVGELRADSGGPSTLDEGCTVAFLTQTDSEACPFDPASSITEQVGVGSQYRVNVTLERDAGGSTEILCTDGESIAACGTNRLAVGPSVPTEGRSIAATRRPVSVGETDAIVTVRVW